MEYRILEIHNPKGWERWGVAYQNEGRVLLFIPAWRSPKVLDVSLEELNEDHYPKTEFEYRWGEVEKTENEDINLFELLYPLG